MNRFTTFHQRVLDAFGRWCQDYLISRLRKVWSDNLHVIVEYTGTMSWDRWVKPQTIPDLNKFLGGWENAFQTHTHQKQIKDNKQNFRIFFGRVFRRNLKVDTKLTHKDSEAIRDSKMAVSRRWPFPVWIWLTFMNIHGGFSIEYHRAM